MIGYGNQPLHFGLRCTVPPESEPLTLAEAKAWVRQEQDFTAEDDLLSSLIKAAREWIEPRQKRALLPSTYVLQLDAFPLRGRSFWSIGPTILLPRPRLREVLSVVYMDQGGNEHTLDPSRYLVDIVSQPGRISPTYGQPWPFTRPQVGAVTITYTAGYDDASQVPETTKLAMRMLIAHWYRNREAVGTVGAELDFAVTSQLAADSVGTVF